MGYVPYGNEWKAMLKRHSFASLFKMFGVEREGENKEDYILKIREELLFRRANTTDN